MLLDRAGLPGCPPDSLVSMCSALPPSTACGMAASGQGRARPAGPGQLHPHGAEALDDSDPEDGYVVEGDIVTPAAATAAAGLGLPLTAVFLGNTKLTPEHLRAAPDWLEAADDATYGEIAAWVRDAERCPA